MQKLFALFAVVIIFLSFQNCSKKNLQFSPSDLTITHIETQKTAVDSFRDLLIYDRTNGIQYDLELNSGRIRVMNDDGVDQGIQYCLSDHQKEALNQILFQAEVCEQPSAGQGDRVCAQSYQYPYAAFINGGIVVRLGEK